MLKRFNLFLVFLITAAFMYADETLTVPGEGIAYVTATIADVNLGIAATGRTAKETQDLLSKNANPVLQLLKKSQVENLKTENMQIQPQYNKSNPPQITGFHGQFTISFSAPIQDAGGLIDASIAAGANELQSIVYRPSEKDRAEAKLVALKQASENAMAQASVVLKTLNLKKNAISKVEILGGQVHYPSPRMFNSVAASETELVGGQLEVKANVNLVITYSPEIQ